MRIISSWGFFGFVVPPTVTSFTEPTSTTPKQPVIYLLLIICETSQPTTAQPQGTVFFIFLILIFSYSLFFFGHVIGPDTNLYLLFVSPQQRTGRTTGKPTGAPPASLTALAQCAVLFICCLCAFFFFFVFLWG